MPAKKRDYKREYEQQKARGEHSDRMERQRARRAIDKRDTGKVTEKSPKREGKDVSHRKMLSEGGSNKDGYFLEAPSKNRSRNGHSPKKKATK
jgi:hypothetical protein